MAIPPDIIDWFRDIFAEANKRLSEKIRNSPAIHETYLDMTLIEHLLGYAAPHLFPSQWVIRIDTHYIGGLHHFESWEIADIGVFVFFQRSGRLIRQKVALLQSKRLYPVTGNVDHLDKSDYVIGMARIGMRDPNAPSMLAERLFKFTVTSRYRALVAGDKQQDAIEEHFRRYAIPIYYLFYNPPYVPIQVKVPLLKYQKQRRVPSLGARVIPAEAIFDFLKDKQKSYSPALADIRNLIPDAKYGWRLEHFMADLLLGCSVGRRFNRADQEPLRAIFFRRSGPIAAAIAITVEIPESAELPD